eukprot:GHVU01030749.1.p1 GENE.GHVU01030749.1~~GHVU01030749.1.p1  ORF type:complete len:643 (+),score=7.57 GHVU01030749.1:253-2181(+)
MSFNYGSCKCYHLCCSKNKLYVICECIIIRDIHFFPETLMGWNQWISIPIIIIVTGLYTAIGGLRAVIYTDCVQAFIAIAGSTFAFQKAWVRVGGWQGMHSTLIERHLENMTHVISNEGDFAWSGIISGMIICAMWLWCFDQEMAQRVLCAKNIQHARFGVTVAGFLKILPMFLIVFPGVAVRVMYERCKMNIPSYESWCHTSMDDEHHANLAYPLFIIQELPSGVVGIMISAMIASMMGSLSAVFHSASTVLSIDIWRRYLAPHEPLDSKRVVLVGRLSTLLMVTLSIAWLPMLQNNGLLFLTVTNVSAHLSAPMSAVFVTGILWWRINGYGAMAGLLCGLIISFGQYVMSVRFSSSCQNNNLPSSSIVSNLACLKFNHAAAFLAAIAIIITIVVSLLTPPPDKKRVLPCTLWYYLEEKRQSLQSTHESPKTTIIDIPIKNEYSHHLSDEIEQDWKEQNSKKNIKNFDKNTILKDYHESTLNDIMGPHHLRTRVSPTNNSHKTIHYHQINSDLTEQCSNSLCERNLISFNEINDYRSHSDNTLVVDNKCTTCQPLSTQDLLSRNSSNISTSLSTEKSISTISSVSLFPSISPTIPFQDTKPQNFVIFKHISFWIESHANILNHFMCALLAIVITSLIIVWR